MSNLRHRVIAPACAWPLAVSLSLSLLSGCGSDPKPEAVVATVPKSALLAAPDDPTVRMARAVGDGKPGAALNIKYDLSAKPQVGVPLEVRVAFVPTSSVDAVEVTFSGMDGIVLSGNLTASFGAVQSGSLLEHELTVLPQRTGVFYVTVNASTRFGGSSMGRTFAIPFVVGDQTAQAKPAAPQKDASGKAIQPMKAKEPR